MLRGPEKIDLVDGMGTGFKKNRIQKKTKMKFCPIFGTPNSGENSRDRARIPVIGREYPFQQFWVEPNVIFWVAEKS